MARSKTPIDLQNALRQMDINSFIELCYSLRYIADPEPIEEFRLPHVVIQQSGGDCDDISILVAYYCYIHGLHHRHILWAKEQTKTIEHISTEIKGIGNVDPFGKTYYQVVFAEAFHA